MVFANCARLDTKSKKFGKILWKSRRLRKKLQMKKNVVLRQKLINKETKEQFQHLMDNLNEGQGILTIDFKENITLGRGPRELGQSWYTRGRRTIFGMALFKREADGGISKWHLNQVSDCFTL
jgi:hypothetical protein